MRRYLFAIIFFSSLSAITPPIINQPIPNQLKTSSPNPQSAEQWYEWALVEIHEGRLVQAKKSLEKALAMDPEMGAATVQLGFIELWEKNDVNAYDIFLDVLAKRPCDLNALQGLKQIGSLWNQDLFRQEECVKIYSLLNTCQLHNADYLYFLGRAYARTKQWDEAQKTLKQCLEIAPQYADADIQLGYIDLWQNRLNEAAEIFEKYPQNSDAKMGLALVKRRTGNLHEAKKYFEEVLQMQPKNNVARREKAKVLSSLGSFAAAEVEYRLLSSFGPLEDTYWAELFDVKTHTRPAIFTETLYVDAKENDPSLLAPVVKDYYFLNNCHVLLPLADRLRLDLKQIYYHQRENDIYPPIGVNYSMYETGGELIWNCFFAPHWRWNVSFRVFDAWGTKHVNYPFQNTTRFEPGTSLLYNSEKQLFSLDAHRESYVIKDFSIFQSRLLSTDYLTAGYTRRLIDVKLKPEFEAWLSHVFIHDRLHNWKNSEMAIGRINLPFTQGYFTAIYRFEFAHYDQLNVNYYSFKQQFRNVIGCRIRVPLKAWMMWENYYYHRWQTTIDLYQPIGNFVYIAPKQFLIANWFTSSITARYRDLFRFSVEGGYYYDTLPYRSWHVAGSLLLQF